MRYIHQMIYQFGTLTLDTNLYRLSRDGEPIDVEPQVFDLLVRLVENRDRVIPRNELLDTLWKGQVVSDSALSARLKSVRKAVGDSGHRQSMIKTIHGRGYQFIAEVEELSSGDAKLGDGGSLSLPDKPSIAVLPFQNLSNDPEQEYFGDGITEDIIAALSKIPDLLVVARSSTMAYKRNAIDVNEIGREQGVRHVLKGSIRKSSNRIRVTAQLIDTSTGHHQWAERYDRKIDDIFDVQDEITKQVTTELQVQLTRGEEARAVARETSDIVAWGNVVRAYSLSDGHIKEHNAEAQRLAEEAVHLDPTYAVAWVTLGWTHWEDALWGWGESQEVSMKKAQDCVGRALEINSEHSDALALLGTICLTNKDAKKAIELCTRAVELSPNHANNVAFEAMARIFGAEPKKGLTVMKRAIRLSPIYPTWYLMMVGAAHHILGAQDKAIEIFRECMAQEPESSVHRIWLVSSLIDIGKNEEASTIVAEILEIDPDFTVNSWVDGFSVDEHLTNLLVTNLVKAGLPG